MRTKRSAAAVYEEKTLTGARRRAIPICCECPSCGKSGDVRIFVRRIDSDWALCGCGLVYLQTVYPEPEQSAVHAAGSRKDTAGQNPYERRRRRRIAKSRHQILDVLNHTNPGSLLDIGCSLGYTLEAAEGLGLAAAGVEIDTAAVERCRRMGFSVERANMSSLPFDDERFQIVTMKHVLEHTPDPRAALREVRRVLKPGGGLFIAVPHLQYHKALRSPETYHYFRVSRDIGGDGHYVYYTPDSLGKMLKDMGFAVVKVDPHLIHRGASIAIRLVQTAVSPARRFMQYALTTLHLRKEFWLTAIRDF